MNSGVVREIVYEDDEIVAYADYDLAGRIYSEKEIDLYITRKKGIEYIDYTITLDKLSN